MAKASALTVYYIPLAVRTETGFDRVWVEVQVAGGCSEHSAGRLALPVMTSAGHVQAFWLGPMKLDSQTKQRLFSEFVKWDRPKGKDSGA